MNRSEILGMIAALESELGAVNRLAGQLEKDSASAEALNACCALVAESKENVMAGQRILKWHDKRTGQESTPGGSELALPQTVGDRLRDFLASNGEPFTVEQARAWIQARFSEDVTASAVAQALRRMVLVGNEVKQVKEGKGPLPAYFRRISITDNDVILAVLNNHQTGLGKTENQIAEETGIAVPIVCRILQENQDSFVRGADNLWRKLK
jgi:hypothetical protein